MASPEEQRASLLAALMVERYLPVPDPPTPGMTEGPTREAMFLLRRDSLERAEVVGYLEHRRELRRQSAERVRARRRGTA